MTDDIREMLSRYKPTTIGDKKNVIKEVIQEIVLCGLARTDFFTHAAFYGGTALRIFHSLDRFSEDLDFSLASPDPSFDLQAYIRAVEDEVSAFGLSMSSETKTKSVDTGIRTSYLRGGMKEHILKFYPGDSDADSIPSNELVKIKIEIDVNPPPGATFETKRSSLPEPYELRLYDMPSLFAGKIGAVLCRGWKSRIKGRDLYDYVFYLSRRTPVNMEHLHERLVRGGKLAIGDELSLERLKQMLCVHFDSLDFENAKLDVLPFVDNDSKVRVWSPDFFKDLTESLTTA